jgi:hypothetical protein
MSYSVTEGSGQPRARREPGYYWVRIPQRTPGGPTTSDVVSYTHGDGRWFFAGLLQPRGEFEVVPLVGPLKFEPEAPTLTIERLTSENRALTIVARSAMNEREAFLDNLTATQTRCTELLDESRVKGREIRALEGELKAARRETNAMIDQCHDLSVKAEAAKAAQTEVQAATIRRLRAIGYRVVKRCGACVSLAFEK